MRQAVFAGLEALRVDPRDARIAALERQNHQLAEQNRQLVEQNRVLIAMVEQLTAEVRELRGRLAAHGL